MSRKVYYFILKMKLQLTLLVLGLTYVLSAPTDPFSAEPNDSSSEHSLEENDPESDDELSTKLNRLLDLLDQILNTNSVDHLTEKESWIKIKEGLEETKTKGLEINTFIQEKYNNFQDLDKHITGADDASKDYFNVLVEQFEQINEKTIPCQEGLKTAKQLVSEKMTPGKSYPKELNSIDISLFYALDELVSPYEVYMPAFKSQMEDAFDLEDEQEKKEEIKEVVESIKGILQSF